MKILFTRSDKVFSRLIRRVTGEPVSHCAIGIGNYVLHSNFYGVHAEPFDRFSDDVTICGEIEMPDDYQKAFEQMCAGFGRKYDWGAMAYLAARSVFPCLPKKNLWQCSGMYLCTEWVSSFIDGKEDSMITPYKLFRRLSDAKGPHPDPPAGNGRVWR